MMIIEQSRQHPPINDPKSKDAALEKAIGAASAGPTSSGACLITPAAAVRAAAHCRRRPHGIGRQPHRLGPQKSGIELVRQYDTQTPVEVVPGALEQVFLNLLLNARNAMNGHGGRLTVSVAEDGTPGAVAFSVQDTGCGIPPEHLDQIFDPFFTIRPRTAKSGDGGSGLGLAVARDLTCRRRRHLRSVHPLCRLDLHHPPACRRVGPPRLHAPFQK